MAKKQTRRSISVSRTTYERLKAFCETNNISMSQLVETRVNDFLGGDAPGPLPMTPLTPMTSATPAMSPIAPRPVAPRPSMPMASPSKPLESRPAPAPAPVQASAPSPAQVAPGLPPPMTSAAARFAVDPPPPIIKPRQDTAAPKPAEKRPEQIFTF
jgi:hypothetical protein